MKHLLACLLFLACLPLQAAPYVTLTNLNARYFTVSPATTPTNVVMLRLNTSQFDTTGDSITITNISGPSVTNYVFLTTLQVTNLFIEQNITLRPNSTLFITNNAFITTNTFLFVTDDGQIIGVELEAGNGITITSGTNIAVNATYDFPWTGTHTYTENVGAVASVGDTTFVDVTKAHQTNQVSGAISLAHATNGIAGTAFIHVRKFYNSSGSDQTLTLPSGWRTNVFSAVPPALTNNTITRMVLECDGPTDSAASQTNCYVSFEFYK